MTMRRERRVWLERGLLLAGVACLSWVGFVVAAPLRRPIAPPPTPAVTAPALPTALAAGAAIGTLAVPRLGLSAMVAEGDADAVLDVAAGHLPDTPLPWLDGNSAIAAHRDTHFRPLRDIKIGDEMTLATPHGVFSYIVRETLIVRPDEVWVLAPAGGRELTLITCYPFNYIGNAPKRFIVKADAVLRSD